MQQAIRPNCDNVTYNELVLNPKNFLIFLKDGDKIIGFISQNALGELSVQTTSAFDDAGDFYSMNEIVNFYSRKVGHEVTIWYEKVENCA